MNANGIQPFRAIGRLGGNQVNFRGKYDLVRNVGKFPMQGLAADDHEAFLARNSAGRPEDVIKLLLLHGACALPTARAGRHTASTDAVGPLLHLGQAWPQTVAHRRSP